MENDKVTRYYWLDILKIIACICVVINHTSICLIQLVNDKLVVLFYCIMFSICKIGVPIFLMVTGYLLMNKVCEYKIILKRIIRVLIPLLIISLLFYIRDTGLPSFNIFVFIKSFLTGSTHYSLWYLYMLIGVYLTLPFTEKMIKNFNDTDYKFFIVLFLLIPSFIFSILNIFDINLSQNLVTSIFPMSIAYIVSSIYISKIKLNKTYRNVALILFLIFTIILVLYMYLTFIYSGAISYKLDSWMYITTLIPSLSIFYLIRYIFENKKLSNVSKKVIKEVSLVTFGIYLFHCILIEKIYTYEFVKDLFTTNPYVTFISLIVVICIISGICTYILRKIPIIKKYL